MSRVCGSGHNSEKYKDPLGLSGSMAICSKHVQRQEQYEKIQASTLSDQPLFHLYARDYHTSGQPLPFSDTEILNTMKGVMPAQNQKTDDQRIMEGNYVFVKDLADEGLV